MKTKSKIIKAAAVLSILLAAISCEKKSIDQMSPFVVTENNFDEFIKEVENNFDQQKDFVDSFIEKSNNNNIDKESITKMLALLNIENVNVDRLDYINKTEGTYTLIDEIGNNSNYRPCGKLLEIRDAMLDECDKYPTLISDYCAGAVMIAYWWKLRGC